MSHDPDGFERIANLLPPECREARCFKTPTGCKVFVSLDDGRWHMSISHPGRYPLWAEIKRARYALLPPEFTMVMILPPPDQYVNHHPNCFHLWQCEEIADLSPMNARLRP